MTGPADVAAAIRDTELARMRLAATARQLQDRLAPRRLADDALGRITGRVAQLTEQVGELVSAYPGTCMIVGGAAVALVARRPLRRLLGPAPVVVQPRLEAGFARPIS